MDTQQATTVRKIIHIDMDCFYAAVEIRDNPHLANKPVAIGGSGERSVLCTCNYIARKYGIHSAMSAINAQKKCPQLIILPVDMAKYRQVSKSIQQIFKEFTELVEPLALDEAYLDVTDCQQLQNSATLIAEEIRRKIWISEQLTASAGVAPNKFLAKIASGWNKPNGICVIAPTAVNKFIHDLPVNKLFGVGKVTLNKLQQMGINTCAELQNYSLNQLTSRFGKFGVLLYQQSRGIDNRQVLADRPRKSLSVETTFLHDSNNHEFLRNELIKLYDKFLIRFRELNQNYQIKSQFIKIKFADFQKTTHEITSNNCQLENFITLLNALKIERQVRLIGVGVRLQPVNDTQQPEFLF